MHIYIPFHIKMHIVEGNFCSFISFSFFHFFDIFGNAFMFDFIVLCFFNTSNNCCRFLPSIARKERLHYKFVLFFY